MSQYFDQLMNIYWLRPESALWRAIDIQSMKDFQFCSPSLDLGCGDGIFSFIRAGGHFDITFDAYQSVSNLDQYFDKVDIYDSFNDQVCPVISRKPDYQIDYAFDHKENLLKKAKTLGLHKHFVVGDANKKLPFEDNTFRSIFSNIVYWLDDPQSVFLELSRVLKPGGRCCLMLPNNTFPGFSFYHDLYLTQKNEKFRFLEKLDRGRVADNIKHSRDTNEWTSMFRNSGLEIVKHSMHLSKTTVQIWDIGLRPLFPLLHKMVTALNKEMTLDIKRQWIETFSLFLKPMVDMDSELNKDIAPGFHCFVLGKRL